MKGEWSCYGGGQFKRGRMVLCYRGSLFNGGGMAVTEVANFKEGEWSLQKWSVEQRENGHVTEVASLMEGAWLCYRGG